MVAHDHSVQARCSEPVKGRGREVYARGATNIDGLQ